MPSFKSSKTKVTVVFLIIKASATTSLVQVVRVDEPQPAFNLGATPTWRKRGLPSRIGGPHGNFSGLLSLFSYISYKVCYRNPSFSGEMHGAKCRRRRMVSSHGRPITVVREIISISGGEYPCAFVHFQGPRFPRIYSTMIVMVTQQHHLAQEPHPPWI